METVDLDHHIQVLQDYQKYLSEQHKIRLRTLVTDPAIAKTGDIMASLREEVQEQMTYVQEFRRRVQQRGEGATTREVKDMLQASTSLFSMLTKMNEEITNQDRLRHIENATVEAIKTLDGKAQSRFFEYLERVLES